MPDKEIREASLEYHRLPTPGKIALTATKQRTYDRGDNDYTWIGKFEGGGDAISDDEPHAIDLENAAKIGVDVACVADAHDRHHMRLVCPEPEPLREVEAALLP